MHVKNHEAWALVHGVLIGGLLLLHVFDAPR
jgi:hypothetical protein